MRAYLQAHMALVVKMERCEGHHKEGKREVTYQDGPRCPREIAPALQGQTTTWGWSI